MNRFGTHASGEFFTILFLGITEFGFGEKLALFKRSAAWVNNNKVLVVNDTLQSARSHVEHESQTRWHAFIEPDVRDRHSEVDVAHAFTTHTGEGNLHTASVADHTLVFDTLIFTARALPVTGRTENTLTEEAALFWFEGAIVDGLGIFYLSLAPSTHGIG